MKTGRKFSPLSILLVMFVGVPILMMGSCIAYTAFQARRPKDMPNAIWIDAPAVPFGFYRGWWEDCWLEPDQRANHCRLYAGDLHPPTVFEGRYLACDGESPVPLSLLKIRPPSQSAHMWLRPDGVAVILQNGRLLVPAERYADCATIRAKLEDENELPKRTPR